MAYSQIKNDILEREIDPEADWEDDLIRAERVRTTVKLAATIRQLKKDQLERYCEKYGRPEEPERSQSYLRMKKIIG